MLLVTLILYVLGCALMVDNLRAIPPERRESWMQSGFILLIIIWLWPLATATCLVHDVIEPLFAAKSKAEKNKPD